MYGSDEQKQKYLPDVASEKIAALGSPSPMREVMPEGFKRLQKRRIIYPQRHKAMDH
jgi:hypothetical protein